MKSSTYTYSFKNGNYTVSRGIVTKFDWYVTVNLTSVQREGYLEKRIIKLDQCVFLTRKHSRETTEKLLAKYKLL